MIEYSRHARERMARHAISEAEIALCLADPDRIETDRWPDSICYLRCVSGRSRALRVVVRITQRNFVITVHPAGGSNVRKRKNHAPRQMGRRRRLA